MISVTGAGLFPTLLASAKIALTGEAGESTKAILLGIKNGDAKVEALPEAKGYLVTNGKLVGVLTLNAIISGYGAELDRTLTIYDTSRAPSKNQDPDDPGKLLTKSTGATAYMAHLASNNVSNPPVENPGVPLIQKLREFFSSGDRNHYEAW